MTAATKVSPAVLTRQVTVSPPDHSVVSYYGRRAAANTADLEVNWPPNINVKHHK